MSPKIPITKPSLDEKEVDAVRQTLLSGWVTQGPQVAAFEKEFADYSGAPFAAAVSSCTTALHLALIVAGVKTGDEVITVSHSYIATANAIRYCGAIPVFADIDPQTYNIDVSQIKRLITSKTKAILCVHQIGMPCDLAQIVPLAKTHRLKLIEDAACAIGSEILWSGQWQKIGKPHGDIACFSFHPRKIITTGDGGMITTAVKKWDQQIRLLRQHGMSIPDTVRHGSNQIVFEEHVALGFNYRMTDIQAAVGRQQLKKLDDILVRRRFLADRYHKQLSKIPGMTVQHEPAWAKSNWQSYSVRLPQTCDQKQIMQFLLDKNVSTRRGIMCSHREEAYRSEPWSCGNPSCDHHAGTCKKLKQSEEAQDRSILLPLYPQMTEAEQDQVCEALTEACMVKQ